MNLQSLIGHADEFVRIIRKSSQPSDAVLSDLFRSRKYIGSSERRFLSELTFHTLRVLGWVDRLQHISNSASQNALYIALRGLVNVHLEAQMTKASGMTLIDTDIPSREALLTLDDTSEVLESIPICTQEWLREDTQTRWSDADDVWRSMLTPAPLCLRVNTRLTTRERVLQQLRSENIAARAGEHSDVAIVIDERINLLQHPLLMNGIIHVQDEGSQMIGAATLVEPGMRVLDACAGAGGKSLHMADLMGDAGQIVARDTEGARLKETATRARSSGLRSIKLEHLDLRKPPKPQPFDVVLVDAPCSGMGTVRRSPMVKWRLSTEQGQRHAKKQLSILEANAGNVAEGGLLVYATCSILTVENEKVVQSFLASHPGFTLDAMQQYDPYHHGTDGLYWARMRRL